MSVDTHPSTPMDSQTSTHVGVLPGLSIQEAAAELGVSINTIRRQVKSGRLWSEKIATSSGFVYRVFPTGGTQTGTRPDTQGVPTVDTQPNTRQVPTPPPDLARAEAMANYNRGLLEPLVAELGQARQQIAEQAELIGVLKTKLATFEAPKDKPVAPEPTPAVKAPPAPAGRPWWRFW